MNNAQTILPFISRDISGIDGEIKIVPRHFVVEEIPLYDACGEGAHVYVAITREGWTTRSLQLALARLFDLDKIAIGYAGLKDKRARATQIFSLSLPNTDVQAVAQRIADHLPVEVLWARRHGNKLRRGHLVANRFQIFMKTDPQHLTQAKRIAVKIVQSGIANYYGIQRFGGDGDNAYRGREILLGKKIKDRWLSKLLLSAYQAYLFNKWLSHRIINDNFAAIFAGDIAKKIGSGGIFEVEDVAVDNGRMQRREITYTGPIYGSRMRWAGGHPGKLELELLGEENVTIDMLRRARLSGSRRPARLFIDEIRIVAAEGGLYFEFTLPKAAYATTVLREFVKTDTALSGPESHLGGTEN